MFLPKLSYPLVLLGTFMSFWFNFPRLIQCAIIFSFIITTNINEPRAMTIGINVNLKKKESIYMLRLIIKDFPNFSCMFLNPNYFFNLNSNALDMRNFQNKVQKAFCFKSCTVVFWFKHVWFKEDFLFKQDFTLPKMKE